MDMGVVNAGVPSSRDILRRIERLPVTLWQLKVRCFVGAATFFDAFDALAIAFVLPVLAPLWKLAPSQIGLMISAGFLGQLVGALLFGWIGQRFGRVPALTWSIVLFAFGSLACAFAYDFNSLFILRIVQGIGLGGEVPIAAVYINEMAKARGRGRFFVLYELIFPIGLVAAGVIGAWLVPRYGWQSMFCVGAVPALLVLFLRRLLPESPRWLAARGRLVEANAALQRIEALTGRAYGKALPAVGDAAPEIAGKQASWRDLFGKDYLRRTLVVWCIWFVTYLLNYGLVTWLPTLYRTVYQLPLDQSLSYGLITNAFGLVGCVVCALLVDRLGRRAWFTLSFVGAGLALTVLWSRGAARPEEVLVFGSVAYFFISTLSIMVYLYTPEIYPTRARAIGVATATAWLRAASVIGPAFVGSMVSGRGLGSMFLVFGGIALVAGLIAFVFVEETKDRILEEVSP
jgi:MFS transporter, putative metabolite:H+ symporter